MLQDLTRALLCLLLLGLLARESSLAAEPPKAAPSSAAAPAPTAEEKVPPAQTHYMGREIAQTMHYDGAWWLVRESRQREEDCRTLLAHLHLKPGMVVCDLGCGNGFYSLKIAPKLLPGGRVLAVDIQPEMLQLLSKESQAAKIENIEPILGALHDPKLPRGKLDLVLCVDAYHEFSHPQQMLHGIRESLADHGRLVLAEFRAEDPNVKIKPLHKMTKTQAIKELSANGFKLVEQFDQLPWQHLMYFERDDTWQPPAEKP